jgi:hypothetical protein
MEQIYYTQCPLGYGRGASNGFQIKRYSAGYPVTADFRHLNMKAFTPGTRTLAPKALRFRRDGDLAEIAWLAPRTHEYHTERGYWGRPGGLFAHGLRLAVDELAVLGHWTAGLHGSKLWCEADTVPTNGQPPKELTFDEQGLACAPDLAAISQLASKNGLTTNLLALALTAAARVTHQGRTLFLIGDDARISALIQVLTFAFPARLRPELTFSTYHDKPEELSGFRIQGTSAQARPNLPMLMTLGHVLNLATGAIDPPLEPARWAVDLAFWVASNRADEFETWQDWGTRAFPTRKAPEHFDDAWLDSLADLQRTVRQNAMLPDSPTAWQRLRDLTEWAANEGLGRVWLEARPAAWWTRAAASPSGQSESALKAFQEQASLIRPRPQRAPAKDWGAAVAGWLPLAQLSARHTLVRQFLTAWPEDGPARPAFLGALISGLDADEAGATLARFQSDPDLDRALLLPIEAQGAIGALVEKGDPGPTREVLARALSRPGAIVAVLDAFERRLFGASPASALAASDLFGRALADGPETALADVFGWALPRGEVGERWLLPFLRIAFSNPEGAAVWRRMFTHASRQGMASLALLAGTVALEPGRPDEAFRWAVEELFLPLPESAGPREKDWPDAYVARVSFLDLVRRLYMKDSRLPALERWLDQARKAGTLKAPQVAKLDHCRRYAKGLKEQDASWLLENDLPDVPPDDRGTILKQMVRSLGSASPERLDLCLDSCRRSWPGAFAEGVAGLSGIADPMARSLLPYRSDPPTWFGQLRRILEHLIPDEASPFGPDSLASHIVAASTRLLDPDHPEHDPWALRSFLLQKEQAWKALALDARGDLTGVGATPEAVGERRRADDEGADPALGVFLLWYARLDALATFQRPSYVTRFHELMLNAADGPALAAIASARAADLTRLDLPWWRANSSEYPGARNDIREAFARLVPLAPLPGDRLPTLRHWLGKPEPFEDEQKPAIVADVDDSPQLAPLEEETIPLANFSSTYLSPVARARWYALHALSVFAKGDASDSVRWRDLLTESGRECLPLDWLGRDEPYLFLAWLIHLTRDYAAVAPMVPRLAHELTRHRVVDGPRVARWAEELHPLRERTVQVNQLKHGLMDFVRDLRVELDRRRREVQESQRARRPSASP